jgi:phage gpG-like protein
MIEMKISESSLKVLADFRQYSNRVQDELENELDSMGLDIVPAMVKNMRNTPKKSEARKDGHQVSKPGAPPAWDTGHLKNNFEISRIGGTLEVGTNVVYAKFLQEGTKKMKARPFLESGYNTIDFPVRFSAAIRRGLKK